MTPRHATFAIAARKGQPAARATNNNRNNARLPRAGD